MCIVIFIKQVMNLFVYSSSFPGQISIRQYFVPYVPNNFNVPCNYRGSCSMNQSILFHILSACVHCQSCPASGGCSSCLDGYILNADATCLPCPDVDGNPRTCLSCATTTRGRHYDNGMCECKYMEY